MLTAVKTSPLSINFFNWLLFSTYFANPLVAFLNLLMVTKKDLRNSYQTSENAQTVTLWSDKEYSQFPYIEYLFINCSQLPDNLSQPFLLYTAVSREAIWELLWVSLQEHPLMTPKKGWIPVHWRLGYYVFPCTTDKFSAKNLDSYSRTKCTAKVLPNVWI